MHNFALNSQSYSSSDRLAKQRPKELTATTNHFVATSETDWEH